MYQEKKAQQALRQSLRDTKQYIFHEMSPLTWAEKKPLLTTGLAVVLGFALVPQKRKVTKVEEINGVRHQPSVLTGIALAGFELIKNAMIPVLRHKLGSFFH